MVLTLRQEKTLLPPSTLLNPKQVRAEIASCLPSIILIDVLEGIAEGQHLFEQLLRIRLQLPRIHHLAVVLHPIQHQMLLNSMLRWISTMARHKIQHLTVPHHPQIIIFHCVVLGL